MSRISLADWVRELADGAQADVLLSTAGPWSAHELQAARLAMPDVPLGQDDDVALCLSDPLKLALALFALDGRVRRLFVLSPAMQGNDAAELLARSRPSLVISDSDDLSALAPLGTVLPWPAPVRKPGDLSALRNENDVCQDTRWVFATSGTTGRPKLVEHSLKSLSRTVKRGAPKDGSLRWGLLYELSRFAGIQVYLQGLLGGGGLVLPDTRASLGRQLSFLAENGCSALSATPTLWRKLLMTPERRELRLRQITLGGEVADDTILRHLRAEYPEARVVHVYASTEAGAAFSVKDGRAGFPRSYLDAPPAGIRLRVQDDRLFVQNTEVNPTYLGSDKNFADETGFVDTGDVVELQGDRFLFRGRANGAINIGGNKLFPEEVERLLLQHEAVRFARVFARPSPITGQIVVAEVVPAMAAPDRSALVPVLLEHCRAHLQRWQVPAILRVVDHVETTSAGKVERAQA